jgi:glycosyltransferase involved in cell wall biosynthesis
MHNAESFPAQASTLVGTQKVLIAVDSFPVTGGSRVDKFVKFLPRFGVEPILLSAKESVSIQSKELKRRFYPADLKTYHADSIGRAYFSERFLVRGPDAKHYRLLSLLSFPERCVFVPDYKVRWIPLGIRLAKDIVSREKIGVVFTSSPPESTHLIGLYLKQKLGIRWVADFRDLWTEKKLLYRPPTRLHDWWVRRLERKIFLTADHIIANTPENADSYVKRFKLPQERITVIPNGFDRDDLVFAQKQTRAQDVFRIGYSGSLDKHDFPWRLCLEAIRQLALEVSREKVRFVHCGYQSEQVKNYLKTEQMQDLVESHGELPHGEAMEITADTNIRLLMLYENTYSRSIVPMKLYNYLIMNGPILAVAPEQGVTADIIAQTRTGIVISPSRGCAPVYRALKNYYDAWKDGSLSVDPDHDKIARFDRRSQAEQLAKILVH